MASEAPGSTADSIGINDPSIWLLPSVVSFVASMIVAYRPTGDEPIMAVLPWILAAATVAGLSAERLHLALATRTALTVVVVAAWTVLVAADDRWAILGFAVYALCFTTLPGRPRVNLAFAAVASAGWIIGWMVADLPGWAVVIPLGVLAAGTALSLVLEASVRTTEEQAALIAELRETREELALAEHSRGMLAERARLAGEIHDTLAQGLTSIVLLARGGMRATEPAEALSSIEQTAQQNLGDARRLVRALGPSELEGSSLPEALKKHLSESTGDDLPSSLHVRGTATQLPGNTEVALLSALREALANVRLHAKASLVRVDLEYRTDTVRLDVSDDGVGFIEGRVNDRGDLTGGQGLEALRHRVESLSGRLTIRSRSGSGTVLSVELPLGTT